jgi:hypothetical protein
MSAIRILSSRLIMAALLALSSLTASGIASAATVASIALTTPHTSINAGVSETLTAVAKDSGGHTVTGVTFTWSSSSTAVLSITSKGVVKGLKPGTSTVRVAGGGKSATVVITVTAASITLTTPNKAPHIGDEETLTAVAKDNSGHAISGVRFTWKSSKTGIVSITTHGLATALDAGKSTITVTGAGRSASVAINVPVPTALAGVAAKGAAIAGATVTLVDKKGNSVSTTTDVDGGYTLDTTGLKPPFLVSVAVDDTHTLYSVSADADVASVVNISPLTDLIVRSWYSVQGVTIDTAFADPVTNPPPTPDQVQLISNVVVQVVSLWLQQNGVSTSGFSPISTPFAVGDSVDGVLDQTTIDPDTGAITITDGTTTQDSTVNYDTDMGSVSVDSTTTNGTDTSTNVTGTVVATTADMQAALTGVNTALSNFSNTVNTQGANLKASDLLPFIDKNMLNEGEDKTLFADDTADQMRGITVSFQLLNIASLDATTGLADANFTFTESLGDQSQTETVEFFFKRQSDGTWRFSGDQHPAHLSVSAEMRTDQGSDASGSAPDINVDIRPTAGTYSAVTIDGGGVFTNTPLENQGTELRSYQPDPSSSATVEDDRDEFFANSGTLSDLVPTGTPLTITMTPTGGGDNQVFVVKTNAFTTEAITVTNLTGSTLADATLGSPLHVVWTLPKTFAIAEVKLSGHSSNAENQQCQTDDIILSNDATSGDITLPATCNGTVTEANFNVNVTGVNGEREIIIYEFQDPTP